MLEVLLAEIRSIRSEQRLPTVLSKKLAARELSISVSKLKALIRAGDILTCKIGRTTGVPSSEIVRLAATVTPKVSTRHITRSARRPTHVGLQADAVSIMEAVRSGRY